MPNKLKLSGFSELQRDLSTLPIDLRAQSAPIVTQHARRAAELLRATYPVVTGALRAGVKLIERVPRGVAVLYTVTSSAAHAHLYEFGTSKTSPRATFLPITERERRQSTTAVADVVTRAGLKVTGARD